MRMLLLMVYRSIRLWYVLSIAVKSDKQVLGEMIHQCDNIESLNTSLGKLHHPSWLIYSRLVSIRGRVEIRGRSRETYRDNLLGQRQRL